MCSHAKFTRIAERLIRGGDEGVTMSDEGKWLQSLGSLGEVPKLCVERVCNAIGMIYEPTHIRRIARAETDRMRIFAETEVDISDIRTRASLRAEAEQLRQQSTIEEVTRQTLPHITDAAEPSKVTDDWLIHFFGLARDVASGEMRQTWGRILAGEFNRPGSLSRRTLNIVAQIDKSEAALFNTLCCFAIQAGQDLLPLIFDLNAPIYANAGLTFAGMSDLDGLGLIKFEYLNGFSLRQQPKKVGAPYQCRLLIVEFKQDTNNTLPIGCLMLTSPGRQLASVCDVLSVDGFPEYLKEHWTKLGITVQIADAQPPSTPGVVTGSTAP